MSLGPWEIGLIFLVVLLVFGAKRIPEIARGMGKGIREFKDATNDIKQELTVEPPRQIPTPPPQTVVTPVQAAPPVAAPTPPASTPPASTPPAPPPAAPPAQG